MTLTSVTFDFFLNTKPEKTIAFGPGLLQNNKTETETVFYVQARNIKNENRGSGADSYEIEVYTKSEEEREKEGGEEGETYIEVVRNIVE